MCGPRSSQAPSRSSVQGRADPEPADVPEVGLGSCPRPRASGPSVTPAGPGPLGERCWHLGGHPNPQSCVCPQRATSFTPAHLAVASQWCWEPWHSWAGWPRAVRGEGLSRLSGDLRPQAHSQRALGCWGPGLERGACQPCSHAVGSGFHGHTWCTPPPHTVPHRESQGQSCTLRASPRTGRSGPSWGWDPGWGGSGSGRAARLPPEVRGHAGPVGPSCS